METFKLSPEQKEKADALCLKRDAAEEAMKRFAIEFMAAKNELWEYLGSIHPEGVDNGSFYDRKKGTINLGDCNCHECQSKRSEQGQVLN